MTQEKIQQLQLIEQNIQQMLVQKQALQSQLVELDSAVEELVGSPESFRIVGNIMVKSDPEALKTALEEKKRILDMRIESVEKQEEKLRSKAQDIQKDVVESMEDGSEGSN